MNQLAIPVIDMTQAQKQQTTRSRCEVIEFPGSSPQVGTPNDRLLSLLHSLENHHFSSKAIDRRMVMILGACEAIYPGLHGNTPWAISHKQLLANLVILSHGPMSRMSVWAAAGYARAWAGNLRGR